MLFHQLSRSMSNMFLKGCHKNWVSTAHNCKLLVSFRIADIFKRRLKVLLMIDCLLVAFFYGWFTLQANSILPMSRGMVQNVAQMATSIFISRGSLAI